MQSTTRVHDGVANTILQETSLVFDHTIAFHTVNGVFDTDANGRDRTIGCFLRWGEFSTRGLFLRLDDRDPIARIALELPILIQTTATGEGIAFESCQAFIIGLSFIGSTQEAKMTGLIDDEEGFDRMAFLLAAIVFLLILWIGWAVERSRCAIMPERGDRGTPCVRLAASITAKSSAVRAGRSSWGAKA
jgi:hypothetical protein